MRKSVWVVMGIAVALLTGCGSHNPSDVTKDYIRAVEADKGDQAISDMDPRLISMLGEEKIRAGVESDSKKMAAKGGIDKIEVTNEQVKDSAALVKCTVTYKNGKVEPDNTFRLVKVKGDWKITLGL